MDCGIDREINRVFPAKEPAMKALHEAIVKGDLDRLHKVLQKKPRCLSQCFSNGLSPLVLALQRASDEVIADLLHLGANPGQSCKASSLQPYNYNRSHIFGNDNGIDVRNPENNSPVYPLDVALGMEQLGNVILLLHHGASPRDHCTAGCSKLALFAIEQQSVELLQVLLEMDKKNRVELGFHSSRIKIMEHLNLAVSKGLISFVELLLDYGADPNAAFGCTVPMMIAADNGDTAMCRLLMARGAWLQISSLSFICPPPVLARALLGNLTNAVKNLIKLGCDVNFKATACFIDTGHTLLEAHSPMLHFAVYKQNLEALRLLVKSGAHLDATDVEMNTALHVACEKSMGISLDFVKNLLEIMSSSCRNWQKKLLNARNKTGLTPLMVAAKNGLTEVACTLLQWKADSTLHAESKLQRKTALHLAVDSGSEACLLALLRNGCQVNVHCCNHRTALHVAVELDNVNLAEILISHGAKIHAETKIRESCLHLAISAQSLEMVKLLISQRHRVNISNSTGETALMLAARRDDSDICQYIIDQGALLNVRDRNRETALLLSIYFGQERNAFSLIAEGADMNIGDVRQTTPIYWCFFNNRIRTLQQLIIAGVQFTRTHLSFYPKNISAMQNKSLMQWLEHRLQNPCSLQELARRSTRSWMIRKAEGKGIRRLLPILPLPGKLKAYVMFESSEWDEDLEEGDSEQD